MDKWLISWDGAPTSAKFYRRLQEITGASEEVVDGERLPTVEQVLSNIYITRDQYTAELMAAWAKVNGAQVICVPLNVVALEDIPEERLREAQALLADRRKRSKPVPACPSGRRLSK